MLAVLSVSLPGREAEALSMTTRSHAFPECGTAVNEEDRCFQHILTTVPADCADAVLNPPLAYLIYFLHQLYRGTILVLLDEETESSFQRE